MIMKSTENKFLGVSSGNILKIVITSSEKKCNESFMYLSHFNQIHYSVSPTP